MMDSLLVDASDGGEEAPRASVSNSASSRLVVQLRGAPSPSPKHFLITFHILESKCPT